MKLAKVDTKEARRYMTVEEYERAQAFLKKLAASYDTGKIDLTYEAESLLQYAAEGESFEIVQATAELCKDCRHDWNSLEYDEGQSDIYITVVGFNRINGAIMASALMTDIWQIGGPNEDDLLYGRVSITRYEQK